MQPGSLFGVVAGIALGTYSAATAALDLTAGAGPAQDCPDTSYGIALNASSIAYLEPAPVVKVEDYGGGHYAPSGGSNTGIGIGYGELAGKLSGVCLGILLRAEYRAEASKDLLDVLVANHFGKPFMAGRSYDLWMSEYSFKAEGMRVRKMFEFVISDQWSSRLGSGASLLKAIEGQEDMLSGNVTATSSTYAVGAATWVQTASNLSLLNFNPFVAPGRPSAYGYSTDFEWLTSSKAGWSVDVTVIDALGRLYWKEVPRSLQTLNNAEISYNANFDREAFISGIDSRVGYTQNLVPKYQLAIDTPPLLGLGGHAEDDFVNGLHFPSLGARYRVSGYFAELNYDLRTKAVGLGGKVNWLRALVTTNNLRIRSATVVGVAIQAIRDW